VIRLTDEREKAPATGDAVQVELGEDHTPLLGEVVQVSYPSGAEGRPSYKVIVHVGKNDLVMECTSEYLAPEYDYTLRLDMNELTHIYAALRIALTKLHEYQQAGHDPFSRVVINKVASSLGRALEREEELPQ
jgi:hypothetical protein